MLLAPRALIVNGAFPGGAIPLFAIPGILLLVSHAVSRDWRQNTPSSEPAA